MAKTDEDKQRFLDALAESGIKNAACKAAGVSYSAVNQWLEKDAQFAAAYDISKEQAADMLEIEALRRAHDGVERVKYVKDGDSYREYVETTYSDTLLIFLLKGIRPDKFADRNKSELSGPQGRPIQTDDTSVAARIAAMLEAARVRRSDPLA